MLNRFSAPGQGSPRTVPPSWPVPGNVAPRSPKEDDVDGLLHLGTARPGSYQLAPYEPGVWGRYARDDVVVSAECALRLPAAKPARPVGNPARWRVGRQASSPEPRQTPAESLEWGMFAHFPSEHPAGVAYMVGHCGEGPMTHPWRIRFGLQRQPDARGVATVSLTLAAWAMDTTRPTPDGPVNLVVRVNDSAVLASAFEADSGLGTPIRNGNGGFYLRRDFQFAMSALRAGQNEIVLDIDQLPDPQR